MWRLTAHSRICPSGLVYLLRPHFECSYYGASQVVFRCGLMPAFSCLGSEVPLEGLSCRPSSATAFDHLGQPRGTYKILHAWSLPVLDLEAMEETMLQIMASCPQSQA